jgi:hypothetical protein
MKQAVGLQFYFAGYDPRALPWAGMRQAVGLNQLDAQPAPDAIERPRELPWILLCAYKPTALPWAGMRQTFGLSITAPRCFHTAPD